MLNSLNAIRANIEDSPKIAEEILLNLTSILRQVIDYSSRDLITVKEEIDLVTDYVKLMNQRFEMTVKLRIDGVRDVPIMIPPLVLFSLVENSFKHGFSDRKDGFVKLTLETSERIRLIVIDNGTPTVDTAYSGGMGGHYVQARLELTYGVDFIFTHGRMDDGHYEAVIDIPWRT